MSFQLYLASRSPRRSQLLAQLGLRFAVVPADVDETPQAGRSVEAHVRAMAAEKARVGARQAEADLPVLGADTEVVVDGEILGKPGSRDHGIAMLRRLSGREHQVYSAVTVIRGSRSDTAVSVTGVTFAELSTDQAAAYWDTGEPADKAGAYGIQGLGAMFVREIRGSYSGVMGLPLYETAQLLSRFGLSVLAGVGSQESGVGVKRASEFPDPRLPTPDPRFPDPRR